MPLSSRPWLQHYPPQTPHTLDYPEESLAFPLQRAAQAHPTRPALIFFNKEMTYGQLLDEVQRVAGALKALGVKRGDRVAIMLPNTPQAVISYYAVLWLGAVVVMVNPLYTPRELKGQLQDSGATHIVALDLVYPRIEQVRDETALQHVILTGMSTYMPTIIRWLYPLVAKRQGMVANVPADADVIRWQHMFTYDAADGPADVDAKTELAALQYTGGTTGTPKGAMLSHYNLYSNCVQISAWLYKYRGKTFRSLAALPFFHVYGLTTVLNYTVFGAGTMILTPRFDVTDTLKLIQKHKPDVFPGAPTMYVAINNHPQVQNFDLKSIEVCLSGAAPLPVEVQTTFERLTGARLVEGYGLTEASPVTHASPIWDRRKNGTIGLPWPDTDCRIVNEETGEDVAPGEPGELIIKGPQVMLGYWNQPEETAATLKDGWLYTGDVATVDEEGYFAIVDRQKDMIIAGGFNIYPREIEDVLFTHPAVEEAAVIGIPDDYRGETVKAYVTLKAGHSATEDELIKFCRDNLAAYKAPRFVEFRDELPKSLVGKVLRRVLAEEEEQRRSAG